MEAMQITKGRRHKNNIISENCSFLCLATNIIAIQDERQIIHVGLIRSYGPQSMGLQELQPLNFSYIVIENLKNMVISDF